MKKKLFIIILFVVLVITLLCLYPNIEIMKDGVIYKFQYNDDFGEFDSNHCYDESFSYNEKRDISINGWDVKKFLFFHMLVLEYKEGNMCETEYLLTESDFKRIISDAVIEENEDNINLNKLIEGKKAIVSNKRYPWNDEYHYIGFNLDGNYNEMYISRNEDGLIIIQIGNSDEGPKYIAFK